LAPTRAGKARHVLDCVVTVEQGPSIHVALRGELLGDELPGPLHDRVIDRCGRDGVESIVLDLSEVSVISLEGIRSLILLTKECDRRGTSMVVGAVSPQVERRLTTSGVLDHLKGRSSV
jgi:anti-anti-sigma factor